MEALRRNRPLVIALVVVLGGLGLFRLSLATVSGTVTGEPCGPVSECHKPMGNLHLRFIPLVAGAAGMATTRSDGSFSLRLVAGEYRIELSGFASCGVELGPRQIRVQPFVSQSIELVTCSGMLLSRLPIEAVADTPNGHDLVA
jgi:hypothetical protein